MASDDSLRAGVQRLLAQHAIERAVPASSATKSATQGKAANGVAQIKADGHVNETFGAKRGRGSFEGKISSRTHSSDKLQHDGRGHTSKFPVKVMKAGVPSASIPGVAGLKVVSRDTRREHSVRQPPDLNGIEAMLKRLADASKHMTGKCSVAGSNWYEHADTLREIGAVAPPTGGRPGDQIPAGLLHRIKDLADRLFAAEVEAYESKLASATSADRKWMKTVLSTGTASDRLAAMTLLVQESPLHALRHLDGLLALAKKRGRRESQQAIDALKDLFISNLLPSDRKLLHFAARPFLKECDRVKAETLVYWAFEDCLKNRYAQLIAILQDHLSDAISYFKSNALKTVAELLTEKKEQEAALLSTLVNKLGDPQGKIASKAQFLLSQLVTTHEALKGVVVREVRQFLIRSNLSTQAQYFAVVFLNQITLSSKLKAVAADLINTYFTLFELCSKRGQLDTRLLSAILTGINRAFPYTEGDAAVQQDLEKRADALFHIVHTGSFNASVQALVLLQHVCSRKRAVMDVGDTLEDRYYRALYSKISLDDLISSGKHTLFLNLVFKSCKSDPDAGRVRATLKRLAQVALYMPAQFAASSVFLVSVVVQARGDLTTLIAGTHVEVSAAVGTAHADTRSLAGEDASATLSSYDAWKREPKYCGAGSSLLWELLPLALHAHPSVRKFADFVLCNPGAALDYRGDPLVDFTVRVRQAILRHVQLFLMGHIRCCAVDGIFRPICI
jgi:ribosome biogenesis protein MAK21